MASRNLVWSGTVLAVLAVAAVGGAYLKRPDLFQPPSVTTATAILAPVSEAVYGTGTVEPERWAKVVPLQRRRVVELCRCEGQAIKAGQILARQDDTEEVNALHELEINNEQVARDLDRARRDRDKNDAAKTEYEQRSNQFDQSKSRISAQKARIDSLVVRPSFSTRTTGAPIVLVMVAGSRPSSSQYRSRMSLFRLMSTSGPNQWDMSACRATSRRVRFSPPPPTMIFGPPGCSGRGLLRARSIR